MHGAGRGRQNRRVQARQHALGLIEAADQELAAGLQVPGVRGVGRVAVGLQGRARGLQRLLGPGQLARNQRDLGLGHHAAGARQRVFRIEAAGGAAQQGFGAPEIAQLRHGDAAQGQGGRVAPQGDVIEGAQRVAGRQRARSRGDQKVHGHSATFAASSG